MTLVVNGTVRTVAAGTLAAALAELGYGDAWLATAVNGRLVPRRARAATRLQTGDRLEVLSPRQGG